MFGIQALIHPYSSPRKLSLLVLHSSLPSAVPPSAEVAALPGAMRRNTATRRSSWWPSRHRSSRTTPWPCAWCKRPALFGLSVRGEVARCGGGCSDGQCLRGAVFVPEGRKEDGWPQNVSTVWGIFVGMCPYLLPAFAGHF